MKNKKIMLRTGLLIIAFSLGLISTSCLKDVESDDEKQIKTDDEALSKYMTDSSIQAQKHTSGFYYKVLAANDTGKTLSRGNVVSFMYRIALLNGTLLEESTKPAYVKLLWNSIIPVALDRGISLMKTGEKYRFYIPSYLAYYDFRSADIPVNANLVVDVSVIGVQSESDIELAQLDSIKNYVTARYPQHEKFASGLYYVDSVTGTGDKPQKYQRVAINFTRKYLDGKVIQTAQDVKVDLGYNDAVQGLEEGIIQMREGGKALIFMPASIGFKHSVTVLPLKAQKDLLNSGLIRTEVLPYSIVQYVVELKQVY